MPHKTPDFNPPPTGIDVIGNVEVNNNTEMVIWMDIAVSGAGEPGDTVTLSSSLGSIPVTGEMFLPAAGNYQAGLVYTLTVNTNIGTATCSLVAPGPVSIAPDGSQTTWSVEGNEDYAWVEELSSPFAQTYQTFVFTEDINSPLLLSASAFPLTGMSYRIFVSTQESNYTFLNADAGSHFTFSDNHYLDVVR
jgi:hypothetical protein